MTGRRAARLAWSLFGSAVVLQVVGWALSALGDRVPAYDAASAMPLLLIPGVGALVASRRPTNAIGWLFLACGMLLAISGATYGYAAYALTEGRALPGGVAAAWLTSWVFLPAVFGVPSLLFLLFPDGRPLSRRWAVAVWVTAGALVLMSVGSAVRPGPLEDSPVAGVENPVGIGVAAVADAVALVGWLLVVGVIPVACWSLVLRYRRAQGAVREQLRWVALSAVLFLTACGVSVALYLTPRAGVGQALVLVAFSTIPVAAAIAILRHRLYDIDLVINRALVYATLTAALAVVYLATVLVLQVVLGPLTEQSDLAVAGSTLAVAGLFRPARRLIQSAVDRRFYRRRYDAALTLDAFARRLRHELDLDAVGSDLRLAVREAMQPAHVSLWLRGRSPS